MDYLIIVGGGGQARVILDSVDVSKYKDIYIEDPFLSVKTIFGVKVIAKAECLGTKNLEFIVAVGDNSLRSRIVDDLQRRFSEVRFAKVIHPTAYVSNTAVIKEGAVICAGSHVGPFVRVSRHVIVNTHAVVDHDCQLEEFSSIGPNAVLGGCVTVGEASIVAISATIVHGKTVGNHVLIAAGSVVVSNIHDDCTLWMGLPAKFKRKRMADERYL